MKNPSSFFLFILPFHEISKWTWQDIHTQHISIQDVRQRISPLRKFAIGCKL